MRDAKWLQDQLDFLLSKYFANVPLTNPIEIHWGREAKYRFGSIRLIEPKRGFLNLSKKEPVKSVITITSMFRDEQIPLGVVYYTIAHELCHYTHGFSSTNKRLFKLPHHGGIINQELTQRGAEMFIPIFKRWLKEYRRAIMDSRVKF